MLAILIIKSVALPPRKIYSYLPPVKNGVGLRTPALHSIACESSNFILERAVDLFKSESKNTIDIYDSRSISSSGTQH